jgi:hypothetical protein
MLLPGSVSTPRQFTRLLLTTSFGGRDSVSRRANLRQGAHDGYIFPTPLPWERARKPGPQRAKRKMLCSPARLPKTLLPVVLSTPSTSSRSLLTARLSIPRKHHANRRKCQDTYPDFPAASLLKYDHAIRKRSLKFPNFADVFGFIEAERFRARQPTSGSGRCRNRTTKGPRPGG